MLQFAYDLRVFLTYDQTNVKNDSKEMLSTQAYCVITLWSLLIQSTVKVSYRFHVVDTLQFLSSALSTNVP